MKLEVEKELERKLSASQILIEDMEQVIEHCEREDRGIIDPETGHRIGHLKIQHMTYWAEYEVLPDVPESSYGRKVIPLMQPLRKHRSVPR